MAGDYVYAGDGSDLVIFNSSDGSVDERISFSDDIQGVMPDMDDNVYVGQDTGVVKLNSDRTKGWEFSDGYKSVTQIAIGPNQNYIYVGENGRFYKIDIETGEEVWVTYVLDDQLTDFTFDEQGNVYACAYRTSTVVKIDPDTGNTLSSWDEAADGFQVVGILYHNGDFYAAPYDTNGLYKNDGWQGTQLGYFTDVSAASHSNVVVDDNDIIYFGESNYTCAVSTDLTKQWETFMDSSASNPWMTSVSVSPDALFVGERSEYNTHRLAKDTGEIEWTGTEAGPRYDGSIGAYPQYEAYGSDWAGTTTKTASATKVSASASFETVSANRIATASPNTVSATTTFDTVSANRITTVSANTVATTADASRTVGGTASTSVSPTAVTASTTPQTASGTASTTANPELITASTTPTTPSTTTTATPGTTMVSASTTPLTVDGTGIVSPEGQDERLLLNYIDQNADNQFQWRTADGTVDQTVPWDGAQGIYLRLPSGEFYTYYSGTLYKRDSTGENVLWSTSTHGGPNDITVTPNEHPVMISDAGSESDFLLECFDKNDGTLKWDLSITGFSVIQLSNGNLLTGNGDVLQEIDPTDGTIVTDHDTGNHDRYFRRNENYVYTSDTSTPTTIRRHDFDLNVVDSIDLSSYTSSSVVEAIEAGSGGAIYVVYSDGMLIKLTQDLTVDWTFDTGYSTSIELTPKFNGGVYVARMGTASDSKWGLVDETPQFVWTESSTSTSISGGHFASAPRYDAYTTEWTEGVSVSATPSHTSGTAEMLTPGSTSVATGVPTQATASSTMMQPSSTASATASPMIVSATSTPLTPSVAVFGNTTTADVTHVTASTSMHTPEGTRTNLATTEHVTASTTMETPDGIAKGIASPTTVTASAEPLAPSSSTFTSVEPATVSANATFDPVSVYTTAQSAVTHASASTSMVTVEGTRIKTATPDVVTASATMLSPESTGIARPSITSPTASAVSLTPTVQSQTSATPIHVEATADTLTPEAVSIVTATPTMYTATTEMNTVVEVNRRVGRLLDGSNESGLSSSTNDSILSGSNDAVLDNDQ